MTLKVIQLFWGQMKSLYLVGKSYILIDSVVSAVLRTSINSVVSIWPSQSHEFGSKKFQSLFYFRQTPEQDFSNMPDPFGSYRATLSYKDFGPGWTDDKGLDHIEDPEMMTLMQREIAR